MGGYPDNFAAGLRGFRPPLTLRPLNSSVSSAAVLMGANASGVSGCEGDKPNKGKYTPQVVAGLGLSPLTLRPLNSSASSAAVLMGANTSGVSTH